MENKITITLTEEEAEKISMALNHIFIDNFFDISMALSELYTQQALCDVSFVAMNLKAKIDMELDKLY